jgi:DNA-nicking Smr family endonuclease
MSRRRLTPEEIDLWRKVVDTAERMHPDTSNPAARPMPKPKPVKLPKPRATPMIEPFEMGQRANPSPARHDLKPGLSDRLSTAPIKMDRKTHTKMRRGKLVPEDRIDLHGMRLEQAHPVLTRFILSAQASGMRLVLVITGKGKSKPDRGPIPTPHGVLKHHVPQWLHMPPLAQAVLQISSAHISHGGEGAYYVYLRRSR